jgi:rsbT co-antagonist protein RsbR
MRDITPEYEAEQEQKRQADELRVANDRLEQSFATTPLITIEWGTDGTLHRWNPAAERIFGWRAEEIIGQNVFTHIVPNSAAEQVRALVDDLAAGKVANTSRNQNVTKDGRLITCQWYNATLRDSEGRVTAILSQAEDVTERARNEAGLRTFQALAENAPDGIIVASVDGILSYANPAIQALLGYTESLVGAQIIDCIDAPQEQMAEIAVEMGQHGAWQGQIDYRCRNGELVRCHASSFLVQADNSEEAAIVSIVRDITDQIHAEQERVRLQEQVIAAQQAALRELSTPLIPLADHVVAMPLIGSVDSGRAQQVVEELLAGVAANRATTAIIDITGVPVVDTQVAGALLRAAQAVELLGARVVLTGIRPEVAQTLVGIGVNLGSIVTRSTLRDGIAYALRS